MQVVTIHDVDIAEKDEFNNDVEYPPKNWIELFDIIPDKNLVVMKYDYEVTDIDHKQLYNITYKVGDTIITIGFKLFYKAHDNIKSAYWYCTFTDYVKDIEVCQKRAYYCPVHNRRELFHLYHDEDDNRTTLFEKSPPCFITYAEQGDNYVLIKTRVRTGDITKERYPYQHRNEIYKCISFDKLIEPNDERYVEILEYNFVTQNYSMYIDTSIEQFSRDNKVLHDLILEVGVCKDLPLSDEEECCDISKLREIPKSIRIDGILYERKILPHDTECIITEHPMLCVIGLSRDIKLE